MRFDVEPSKPGSFVEVYYGGPSTEDELDLLRQKAAEHAGIELDPGMIDIKRFYKNNVNAFEPHEVLVGVDPRHRHTITEQATHSRLRIATLGNVRLIEVLLGPQTAREYFGQGKRRSQLYHPTSLDIITPRGPLERFPGSRAILVLVG